MLTMQRIHEILVECGITATSLDDVAAYFYSCQIDLTEQDVREIATNIAKKGVDHVRK